jgi:hypothetical protein
MNVRHMVQIWLVKHGYDGLFSPHVECGCRINDLMPCDSPEPECQPGYNNVDEDGEFQISPEKQKGAESPDGG